VRSTPARCLTACVVLAACSRPAPRPPTVVTADDLWRHAPAGSRTALVVTGPALTTGLATARAFADDLRAFPDPEATTQLAAMFRHDGVDFLAAGGPPELELSRGIALFEVDGAPIVLYPARDPAAFARARPSDRVCRPHAGYAACATTAAQLDRLGTGGEAAVAAAAARPPHLRGAVELVETGDATITAVIDIERGAAEVRAHVSAPTVAAAIPAITESPLVARVRTAPASGVLVLDLRAVLPLLVAAAGPRLAALSALRGDLVAVGLTGGELRGWVAFGVTDRAATQKIIDGCDALSTPTLELRPGGGRCAITPRVPAYSLPALEARLDGDVVVIETAGAVGAHGAAAPEVTALLAAPAFLATWGRGIALRPTGGVPPQLAGAQWLVDRIDELGIVVRPERDGVAVTFRLGSVYRNSDEVLARLDAILAPDPAPAAIARGLEALGREHPQSPLARSVALGPAGPLLPLGVLGAVALFGIAGLH
jgi:hypothetical protein